MKTIATHQLEICISADELLELCSGEDLREIPIGQVPTFRDVRFDRGSNMLTVIVAFVPRPCASFVEQMIDSAVDADMEQLGNEVKGAAHELLLEERAIERRGPARRKR